MQFLIIAAMSLAFTICVALFEKSGKNADRKSKRLSFICGKTKRVIDEELNVPFAKRFIIPTFYGILKSFSRLLPRDKQKQSSKLEKNLVLAGIRISMSEYAAIRLIFTFIVCCLTIAMVIFIGYSTFLKAAMYLAGLLLALMGPHYYLAFRVKRRQEFIRHQLPDILDLLTVSVEAGLSFDAALVYIEQYAQGPLVDEMGIVKKEIQMGLPRREALKKLAERNMADELKSFVGALIQSEQIGLPIRNVLRVQASQLRMTRKQSAEEKAMKAPVKMMLPLVAFIFPVTFIILLGPTVLNLIKTFGG